MPKFTSPITRPLTRPLTRSVDQPSDGAVVGPSYSAEATALFARFSTPATDPRKTLINNLIVALKNAGVWTKYDAFYMCAAETAQAAQRNWIADTFNLTEVNSPAFVADRGYTGNGTTSYCDTGFNPITAGGKFVQDDAYIGVWHRTDVNNAAASSFDIGNSSSRFINDAAAQTLIRANRGLSTTIVENYAKDKAYSRTAAAVWRYYNSGVISGTDPRTDTSAALTSFNFGIGRTSATEFGVNQCSVLRFGSSLTTAEQAAEFTAIQTFMTAVGAG